MGKIKGKMVKRASEQFIKLGVPFTYEFEFNKKVLGNEMPSKKIRNQTAGYLARLKKMESKKKVKIEKIV
ncbi:MAG: 30S ribosomal protein S17e [Nanoarchaeota archaeon]